MFNLRGDDGAQTGGLAVDTSLGWKGAEKYVAVAPQIFDLWQDPQERCDIFMNNYTERTWTMVTISEAIKDLMKTYVKYPPRKLQSMGYTGPITISGYQKFQYIREMLAKEGITIPLPTGNPQGKHFGGTALRPVSANCAQRTASLMVYSRHPSDPQLR